MMKKQGCLVMLGFALFFCACTQKQVPPAPTPSVEVVAPSEEIEPPIPPVVPMRSVHFSATGDNLIHDGIYLQAKSRAGGEGYDFTALYENVVPFYQQFDVNWINQETLITDELPPSSYPTFCSPAALGKAAYDAGFRVFSLANNHIYDKGALGIAATRRFWGEMPSDALTTGLFEGEADYDNIPMHEVNGVTIAYLAYTQYTNGIPIPAGAEAHVIMTSEEMLLERQIRRAKTLADFVVVGVHWGNEGSHIPTDAQRALAAKFAEWGAGAIIGTHPHVVQPIEWLDASDGRRVPVAYSLGNFVSSQAAAPNMIGLVFSFEITENEAGGFDALNPAATPVITHYDANYKNIREYLYRDYTDALAAVHGTRARFPTFNRAYIEKILSDTISNEFLRLD